MNTIKIENLKTLFELRKTKSYAKRLCQARAFYFQNKLGLCDASCFLWPVFFSENQEPHSIKNGDIILFSSEFVYKAPENIEINKKYDDLHFLLIVNSINELTPNLEEWKNSTIPNPVPFLNESSVKDLNYTCYYKSNTKKRFHLLSNRTKIIDRVQKFFMNRNFISIDTPTLVPSGSLESYLNPFQTTYTDHQNKKINLQLPTSPELALKKVLTEMPGKIFQIARAYRNTGELSQWHEPEFLMLEWYRSGASLKDILNDTQNLIMTLSDFLGSSLDLPKNWPRFRVDELFLKILGLQLNSLQKVEDFYKAAQPLSLSIVPTDTWNDIFCKLFMEKIEPYLKEQKACFVTHYPIQMAALAAPETIIEGEKEITTNFVHRAEAYLNGIEICNAYLELVDAKLLNTRILETQKTKPDVARDPVFENAMKFGLPPCAGNALGLDRVIAILCELPHVSHMLPIPFLSQFLKGSVAEE